MTPGPKSELRALRAEIKRLEMQFIAPHLGVPILGRQSSKEAYDVAAFIILAHGALENFVEGVALWVLDRAVSNWTLRKKSSRCTVAIALFSAQPVGEPSSVAFDNIRMSLRAAKQTLADAIHENNGVSVRGLRALLAPLGVNVPQDATLVASLETVISIRHQWAHRYRYAAKVPKSAHDARLLIQDCVTFAERIAIDAAAARP